MITVRNRLFLLLLPFAEPQNLKHKSKILESFFFILSVFIFGFRW